MKPKSVKFEYVLPTPVGNMGFAASANGIVCLSYAPKQCKPRMPSGGFAFEVYQQLLEYFNRRRTSFDLPLDPEGTRYQKQVWRQLSKIQWGDSMTYGEIAKKINSGPRAVGNACRSNPISIIVPCHRVVRKSDIGGYSGCVKGQPIMRKTWLLDHEGY